MGDNGYRPNDFAVFYRTNAQSRGLEDSSQSARAYQVVGGPSSTSARRSRTSWRTFGAREPRGRRAPAGVVNTPARGIGSKMPSRMEADAALEGIPPVAGWRIVWPGGRVDSCGARRRGRLVGGDGRRAASLAGAGPWWRPETLLLDDFGYQIELPRRGVRGRRPSREHGRAPRGRGRVRGRVATSWPRLPPVRVALHRHGRLGRGRPRHADDAARCERARVPGVFIIGLEEGLFPH